MKKAINIIIITIIMLFVNSCTESTSESDIYSDSAMNSGTPIYGAENAVYYCTIDDEQRYSIIKKKDNDISVLFMAEQYEFVTSLFVKGDYIYYSLCVPSEGGYVVNVQRKELSSDKAEVLISDRIKGLPKQDDYIYTADNNTVYYFAPDNGLWVYNGQKTDCYIENAIDCVIENDKIYYSDTNGIYRLDGEKNETICEKNSVFDKFKDNRRLNTLGYGSGYITNLAFCNDELYFLITDSYSGGIFKLTKDMQSVESVMENAAVRRFMFDGGKIYFYGNMAEEYRTAIYAVGSDGKVKTALSGSAAGFYVNSGLYYYSEDNELNETYL